METLKLEPIGWINNKNEIKKRNAKANEYSSNRVRNKRKMVMEIIGGALIGAPLLYIVMLSTCVIF